MGATCPKSGRKGWGAFDVLWFESENETLERGTSTLNPQLWILHPKSQILNPKP